MVERRLLKSWGDATGEQAERLKAVGFYEFLGCERHLLGIAENDHDASRFSVGTKGRTGSPDDWGWGLPLDGRSEGVGADQRERLVGREGAFDRVVAGPAALAVDEMENIDDGLAA